MKGRLDKISKVKEGRGKLVSAILEDGDEDPKEERKAVEEKAGDEESQGHKEVKDIADMDRRVGELEKLIGSSSAALDEVGWHLSLPNIF